jgi:hypothetical protein
VQALEAFLELFTSVTNGNDDIDGAVHRRSSADAC